MNMSNYYNFKEGLKDTGRLLTLKEIQDLNTDPNKDYYVSIYKYNDKHKALVSKTGSIAGIKDVTSDQLVWDFDCASDPDKARLDVLTLGHRLVDNYKVDADSIICHYSGSKGFHVSLNIDRNITPEQFKKVTAEIAQGLETYDSVVSDPARVIRLEHTKHPKTGLYKTPIHIGDIEESNMEKIKELAKSDDFTLHPKFNKNSVVLPESLYQLQPKKKEKVSSVMDEDFDIKTTPRGWKPWVWSLAQGYFEPGERHTALMVLASRLRGMGMDKLITHGICKAAIESQAQRFGEDKFPKEELWENIITESVFSSKWQGGQYSPETNPWLKLYIEKMGFVGDDAREDRVIQLDDIQAEFIDFVKNIDENTIKTGIPKLDVAMPLTVGMNLGIVGAASSGKTALALNILKDTSDAGVISLFASLDMRRNRLFEKLLYKVSGLSRTELYKKIENNDAQDIFVKVKQDYKNVYFYDRSCPTVDDIREYIIKIQDQTGKKVKLVMLDYFERVNSDRSEDTAASKEVAGKLQDLVSDFNICLITLVQPNKFSLTSGPDCPILSYTAIKGSSFMYQSFRAIISIWRPFFTPETKNQDKFLTMAILKNDLGELDKFNFGWKGRTGEICELSSEGEEELEKLLKDKEKSKKDEKKDDKMGWA